MPDVPTDCSSSLGIFLFNDTQRFDSGGEADVGQALNDGGGQCFGRVAGVDIAVIVRMELAFGFQGGQYAVAQQLARLQVECATAVDFTEKIVGQELFYILAHISGHT